MCSWGQAAKNSPACSHEWRAQSNITLVFSITTWHGLKREKKVIFWPWLRLSVLGTNRVQSISDTRAITPQDPFLRGPTCWIVLLCLNTRTKNILWKQPGERTDVPCLLLQPSSIQPCSMKSPTFHAVMTLYALFKLLLCLYDTKAASGSTWLPPWII